MQKREAIELLGNSVSAAAQAVGITVQAVSDWPEILPPRIRDRVQAALYRRSLESAVNDAQQLQAGLGAQGAAPPAAGAPMPTNAQRTETSHEAA